MLTPFLSADVYHEYDTHLIIRSTLCKQLECWYQQGQITSRVTICGPPPNSARPRATVEDKIIRISFSQSDVILLINWPTFAELTYALDICKMHRPGSWTENYT